MYPQFFIETPPQIQGPFRYCYGAIYNPGEPIDGALDDLRFKIAPDPHYTTGIVFLENSHGKIGYAILKADFSSDRQNATKE